MVVQTPTPPPVVTETQPTTGTTETTVQPPNTTEEDVADADMQNGDDDMLIALNRGHVLQMTGYTDKWCQKYWTRHGGINMVQHTLT